VLALSISVWMNVVHHESRHPIFEKAVWISSPLQTRPDSSLLS
jgi:hypothetical protein